LQLCHFSFYIPIPFDILIFLFHSYFPLSFLSPFFILISLCHSYFLFGFKISVHTVNVSGGLFPNLAHVCVPGALFELINGLALANSI
jgi:hypothetical protein